MHTKLLSALGLSSVMTAGCSLLAGLRGPKVAPERTPLTDTLAGKVVFARETIPKGASDVGAFSDTVQLGDPIHGRAYFATSVGQRAAQEKGKCHIASYTVEARSNASDWVHVESYDISMTKSVDEWTTVRVDGGDKRSLVPQEHLGFPADRSRTDYRVAASVVPLLHLGDNAVEFRVTQGCMNPLGLQEEARGTLNIQVASAQDRAAWRDETGPTLESAAHPEAAQLIADTHRDWDATEGTLLEVTVLASGWRIERHAVTGLPLRRELPAGVVTGDGEACVARVGFLISEHDGSAYTPPKLFWKAQHSRASRFPCDNVNATETEPPSPGAAPTPALHGATEEPDPGDAPQ